MPTAETTLMPAYSANQMAHQIRLLTRIKRLDNEPDVRGSTLGQCRQRAASQIWTCWLIVIMIS